MNELIATETTAEEIISSLTGSNETDKYDAGIVLRRYTG
jgi:hypothetical protein